MCPEWHVSVNFRSACQILACKIIVFLRSGILNLLRSRSLCPQQIVVFDSHFQVCWCMRIDKIGGGMVVLSVAANLLRLPVSVCTVVNPGSWYPL